MKHLFFAASIACLSAVSINAKSHKITTRIHNTVITVLSEDKYDITCATTEAIVNPANSMLAHGGGIARAISKAVGPQLQAWSDKQPLHKGKRVAVGNAIISTAFNLRKRGIKYIVHTVGPDFRDAAQKRNGNKLLYNAWKNTLVVADKKGITSITFPSISTGIFKCPKSIAAMQARRAIEDFLNEHPNTSIKKIVIGLWEDTWDAYKSAFTQK